MIFQNIKITNEPGIGMIWNKLYKVFIHIWVPSQHNVLNKELMGQKNINILKNPETL